MVTLSIGETGSDRRYSKQASKKREKYGIEHQRGKTKHLIITRRQYYRNSMV